MTWITWSLNLLAALLLMIFGGIVARKMKTPLFPSAFFSLYWSFTLLMVIVFAPDFDLWPGALLLIMLLVLALHFGTIIGTSLQLPIAKPTKNDASVFVFENGPFWLVTLSLAGFLAAYLLISNLGLSVQSVIANPIRMIEIGQQYANLRYGYGQGGSLIVNILNVFLYLACMLSGVWIALGSTSKDRLIGLIPLLAGLLQAVLVSARTGFIWMCVLLAGSYLATYLLRRDRAHNFGVRTLFLSALIGIALLSIFVFSIQVTRHDLIGDPWSATLSVRINLFGSPSVFSHWLKDNWDYSSPYLGAKTFGGLADLFGIAVRGQGLGWEGMSLPGFQGFTPNVYTAMRQLIEDFTLPGTITLMFGIGIVTGMAYRRVCEGHVSWIPLLTLFYGVTLGSYLANWLNYNTILFAWILFFFYLSFWPRPVFCKLPGSERRTSRRYRIGTSPVRIDRL